MEEKRKNKRLDLDVNVQLERLDEDGVTTLKFVHVDVTDISKSGIGFDCKKKLEINTYYDAKIQTAEQQCQSLRNEIEKHMDGKHDKLQWLRELNYQTDVECFTREVVLYFIDAVKIMENGELEIAFRFADAYADTLALVEKAKKNSLREVV